MRYVLLSDTVHTDSFTARNNNNNDDDDDDDGDKNISVLRTQS